MTNESNEIKEVIKKHYPHLDGYYLGFLDDMLKYLEWLEERESQPEKLVLTWTYPETILVGTLNDAVEKIKYHLIENKESYIWRDIDNPKDDYEKGLYNAMRFLQIIVHHTNPS